jgi:hypothetical protein
MLKGAHKFQSFNFNHLDYNATTHRLVPMPDFIGLDLHESLETFGCDKSCVERELSYVSIDYFSIT